CRRGGHEQQTACQSQNQVTTHGLPPWVPLPPACPGPRSARRCPAALIFTASQYRGTVRQAPLPEDLLGGDGCYRYTRLQVIRPRTDQATPISPTRLLPGGSMKPQRLVLLTVVVFLGLPAAHPAGSVQAGAPEPKDAPAFLQRGLEWFNKKDYDKA